MEQLEQLDNNFQNMEEAYNSQLHYNGSETTEQLKAWERGELKINDLTIHNQYLAHYKSALAGGALSHPQVASVVDSLSTSVTNISDNFEGLLRTNGDYNGQTVSNSGEFITNMKDKGKTSWVSHTNSAGICETGGGNDSGTLCGG